ncbi:rhomboid family intramembrane serine protease [Haloferax namakaokahaiae]|uniref:Rhomboid family intramembrane serine protease n=1 Tax=Haloferax namakaokahaiae TaxID=1748331 RepID=A0ABD5ZE22_9EURY
MSAEWDSFEEYPGADETLGEAILRNPVVQTLVVMLVVSTATWITAVAGLARFLFVLSAPLAARPWTLVTSVYAHAGPGHLLSNAIGLVLFGGLVAMSTTRLRFHLFFVVSGMLAGTVQILAASMHGLSAGVLGASGAVFALIGYVLTSNLVSKYVLDRLNMPLWLAVFVTLAVAALLTFTNTNPGVALMAHFTGAVVGLVAGRFRLLHT